MGMVINLRDISGAELAEFGMKQYGAWESNKKIKAFFLVTRCSNNEHRKQKEIDSKEMSSVLDKAWNFRTRRKPRGYPLPPPQFTGVRFRAPEG